MVTESVLIACARSEPESAPAPATLGAEAAGFGIGDAVGFGAAEPWQATAQRIMKIPIRKNTTAD